MSLNTIEQDDLIRVISDLKDRISRLEAMFQGQPIPSARIGDLTLGGADNNDGILRVKDEDGNLRGQWDKDGITIKDENNTTIIDAIGLVSAANFQSDITSDDDFINTDSISYVDTGLELEVVLPREAKVLIFYSAGMANAQAGASNVMTEMSINIDGTDEQGPKVSNQGIWYSGLSIVPVFGSALTIVDLSSGTHTLKLRYKQSLPTGSADSFLSDRQLMYVVLGK